MSATTIIIGSGVFALLGIFACTVLNFIVSRKSKDRISKYENRSLVCSGVVMTVFCCWLQWICVYMHQMNPIILPYVSNNEEH